MVVSLNSRLESNKEEGGGGGRTCDTSEAPRPRNTSGAEAALKRLRALGLETCFACAALDRQVVRTSCGPAAHPSVITRASALESSTRPESKNALQSFLRKGVSLGYVGSIKPLKDLKDAFLLSRHRVVAAPHSRHGHWE